MGFSMRTSSRLLAPALVLAIEADLSHAQPPASEPQSSPSAWLQLGNGTDNAGVVPGSLEATWRFKARRPVRGLSVAEGIVLLGTESADADAPYGTFSGDQRGFVTALDANTGKELWTHGLPSWIHGDPAIYKGRGFVTFGRWPMLTPGGVMAYDLRSGDKVWSLSTTTGIMPAPAVDTSTRTLIVAGGGGVLYELSLDDGSQRHVTGLRNPPAMSSPRIDSHRSVYVGGEQSLMKYSIDRKTITWKLRVPGLNALGDVTVALADTVVFTTGWTYYGIWKAARDLPLRQFVAMALKEFRTRALGTYSLWFRQQWLLAIDRRDGRLLWRRPLGIGLETRRNSSGTPVVTGNRVIISSPISGIIRSFDIGTGRELWSRKLEALHKGAVTVIGDEMLLGDRTGTLSLLRLSDGAKVGWCRAGGSFTVLAPVLVGRTLFTATTDGWVHAIPYDSLRRALQPGGNPCF